MTEGKCPLDVTISVSNNEIKIRIDGIKKGYDFIFAFLILYGNNIIANNDKYEYIDIPPIGNASMKALKIVMQITAFV